MQRCARSAGPQPRLVAAGPRLVLCCPTARRRAGAAVPSPSRAVRGRPRLPCRVCAPPAARARRGPGGEQGREGRRGRARAGGAGRKEGSREGREERCGRRGECEGRTEGRRRAAGLCPRPGPGGSGRARRGCSTAWAQGARRDPAWGDPGTSAAKGLWLGVSAAPALERSGGVGAWGHLSRPVGSGCRRGDPCEGGRRRQPAVPAPASPERSGELGGVGPKRGEREVAADTCCGEMPRRCRGRWWGGGRVTMPGAWGLPSGREGRGRTGKSLQRVAFLDAATAFAPLGPELFGAKQMCVRRGWGECLPFFPVGPSVFMQRGAVPGGEAAGQPRLPLPPARARCELGAAEKPPSPSPRCPSDSLRAPSIPPSPTQGRLRSRGQSSIGNGGVRSPSSRLDALCSAPAMCSGRGTGQVPVGLDEAPGERGLCLGFRVRPFGGAGEGTTPFAAPCRATRSLGFALPLRGCPVAGQPRLDSPSRRLSSARHRSRVWEPRAACTAWGSGVAGCPLGDLGFRGCSPTARRGPAGSDSRRVPCSPDTAGRVGRPRGTSAPGLSPTWRRFQLGLYLRSREGERDKAGKWCVQARHGQPPRAPRLCWGAGFGAFLNFQWGIFSFLLGQRLPGARHTSGKGLPLRVPLAPAPELPEVVCSSHPRLLAFLRYRPKVP